MLPSFKHVICWPLLPYLLNSVLLKAGREGGRGGTCNCFFLEIIHQKNENIFSITRRKQGGLNCDALMMHLHCKFF